MHALCNVCGHHHEVVRVLDDKSDDLPKTIYQVEALAECTTTWLTDAQVLEARARFGLDAILDDEEP